MAGYAILLHHDEMNSVHFVAEAIAPLFGYEKTQAYNCAYLMYNQGQYVAKRYKASEKCEATNCLEALQQRGIPAEIIRL